MQRIFGSVKELLQRLYTERNLISEMFNNRKRLEFRYDDAREFVESEKNLQLLIDYGVIRQEGEQLELEEAYLEFLENILHVNEEISNASVEENVALLKESVDFYLKERNNPDGQRKYLNKVKRTLRNIAQMAVRNTVDLKRNVNDTYKHERNYAIKRARLEKFLSQIAQISHLVKDTELLLDDQHATFSNFAPDQQLSYIITDVRTELKEVFHSLIELEITIRDYLHQIDAHNRLVKKIRRLKYLKDQLVWKSSTNICQILEATNHVWLEPHAYYFLKPSLQLLRNSDEGLDIINTVHGKISQRIKRHHEQLPPITTQQLSPQPVIEDFVDTDALATAFMASGRDLFAFVVSHNYETEQTLEQRVGYYTEIIQNHFAQLSFTDEWHEYEGISYPLIYPNKSL